MKHSNHLREHARQLRGEGLSYAEILEQVPISQSTISLWCRDVLLVPSQHKRLKQLSLEGASRARTRWAEIRRTRKVELLAALEYQATRDIGTLSPRDRFIAGVMLYAGEGDRTQERVGISNADPRMLRFALDWLCEFLGADRSQCTVHLYLHQGKSESRARQYWMRALQTRKHQFRKSYRPMPRVSHKGNVHEFGICAIRLHDRMMHRTMTAWINAILNHQNHSRVAQLAEHLAVSSSGSFSPKGDL